MRFIRKIETARLVGWHPSHLMRKARAGEFVQPVQLGPNSVAFVADEVERWMQDRADARAVTSAQNELDDRADKREVG